MKEQVWHPKGDGCFCILSHFNPLSGTQRYSRDQITSVNPKFRAAFDQNSRYWASRNLDEERALMSGQAVFIESDLAGAFLALDLKPGHGDADAIRTRIAGAMQAAIEGCPEMEALQGLTCVGADALVFEGGEISIAARFVLPGGWDSGALASVFTGPCRNRVSAAFCDAASTLYSDIITNLHRELAVERKTVRVRDLLGDDVRWDSSKPVRLQSLNILFAGEMPSEPPSACAPLSDDLRALVYPSGPRPVTSQSPRLDEFVFLGYAFSMVISSKPDHRMREMALIIRLMHALFNQLGAVSHEVQAYLRENRIARIGQIRALKRRVRNQYDQLHSPTFTFRHEMLIFRDHIFTEWFLDRELAHAEHLIDALIAHEQARESRTRNRFSASMSALLFIIALMSLVSVAADFRTLTDARPAAIPAETGGAEPAP